MLTATPQAGTNYIYTTLYISDSTANCPGKVAGAWCPFTLSGNSTYPSYSGTQASLTLNSTQLSQLTSGAHYAVLWDWLWDTSKNCYVGPALNACGTGTWRVQTFSLTGASAPANPVPGPDVFILPDDGTMINANGSVNDVPITKKFYQQHSDAYDFLAIFTNAAPAGNDFFTQVKNDVSGIGRAIVDNTATFGSAGNLRGVAEMSSIDIADENANHTTYFWLAHELGHAWAMSLTALPSGTNLDDGFSHFWPGLMGSDRYEGLFHDLHIIDHRDGTYSAVHYSIDHMSAFHPFTLYLMGLIPAPASTSSFGFNLVTSSAIMISTRTPYYENGQVVGTETRIPSGHVWVSMNDIITAAGSARQPSYTSSPKTFTVGYILVTKAGTAATAVEINRLNTIAEMFPQKWNYATQGKSTIVSTAPPVNRLALISATQTIPQGRCSGRTDIQAQDANGSPLNVAMLTSIRISGTPIVPQVFNDSSCTATSTQVAIQAGKNSISFYFRVAMDGTETLEAYGAGLRPGTQTETIQIYPRPKFAFLAPPQTLAAGSCSSKVTIQLQNAGSLPVTLGLDERISIAGNPTAARIYSDPVCQYALAPNLFAGSSSLSFYFVIPSTGQETLAVTAPDVQAGIQVEAIQ